jgi:UDP:flavonoid glycosyltransferase YjiC (YdhE family)
VRAGSLVRVGIDLRTDRPSPNEVRDGVRAVLADSAYADRARTLAAAAAAPSDRAVARAVTLLTVLATTARPVTATGR